MMLCISVVSVVTSFLFLILFIWIFFFLWLVWLKVCWFLLIFLKNQISITSNLFSFFSLYLNSYFHSHFITLSYLIFFFTNSELCSLSSFFRCKITLFTWNLFISFLRQACITYNFPLRTTLAVLHRIWYAIFLF